MLRRLFLRLYLLQKRTRRCSMKLHRENPYAKIAVMNFANAFHAGGGVTTGESAQEECLCRTSTLYPLLYRRTLRDGNSQKYEKKPEKSRNS